LNHVILASPEAVEIPPQHVEGVISFLPRIFKIQS
jgi:hypothetical protein